MKRVLILVMLLAATTLAQSRVTVTRTEYNGWKDALILSNGKVEAIIIPSIGRVMQFRFVGEEGVFWENQAVAGNPVNPESKEWINFGGDKPWPAPQADWPKVTPRAWPPPVGFDASVWELFLEKCERAPNGMVACSFIRSNEFTGKRSMRSRNEFTGKRSRHLKLGNEGLAILSPPDPHYGIRIFRTIGLDPVKPEMTITTFFEKASGNPVKVGVWVITQMNEAEAVYVPIPKDTQYPDGYNKQSKELPEHFNVVNGLIELKRDPKKSTKIGSDAGSLLWVGQKHMLRIDSPRMPKAEYPDNGSSAEVYTNLDPLKYIELEMLGPLKEMKEEDRLEHTNVYTLIRRSKKTPEAEARNIFKLNKPAP